MAGRVPRARAHLTEHPRGSGRLRHDRAVSAAAGDAGRRRARWWSPLLVAHALLVVVLLVLEQEVAQPGSGIGWADAFTTALRVLLTAPWLLVLWSAPLWALLVGNLVLHLGLLRAFGRRDGDVAGSRPASRSAQFGMSVLAGAVLWGAWLGWDTTASYDVVTRQVESPHVTLQVLGCAVAVGVVAAVLGTRWWWAAVVGGVSVGFWLPWTAQAGASDPTGLYLAGAFALAIGLGAGTSFAVFVGRVLTAARPKRSAV